MNLISAACEREGRVTRTTSAKKSLTLLASPGSLALSKIFAQHIVGIAEAPRHNVVGSFETSFPLQLAQLFYVHKDKMSLATAPDVKLPYVMALPEKLFR